MNADRFVIAVKEDENANGPDYFWSLSVVSSADFALGRSLSSEEKTKETFSYDYDEDCDSTLYIFVMDSYERRCLARRYRLDSKRGRRE